MEDSPEIIGILGGMGPAATADFYAKLIANTPARSDQDHLTTVIWSDPTVPDRSQALLGRGPDPTPWLLRGAEVLCAAGATCIAIPCNTAHAFIPRIAGHVSVPVIHMISEVTGYVTALRPPLHTVGLLPTTGTARAGLYQEGFAGTGIGLILPDHISQDVEIMPAIRAIKAGAHRPAAMELLKLAAGRLIEQGAQTVIAGCSEIPLALAPGMIPVPLIDPALVLANAIIQRAWREDTRPRMRTSGWAVDSGGDAP